MSHKHFASLVGDNSITVFYDNRPYTIAGDHVNFAKVKEAIRNKAYDLIPGYMNIRTAIANFLSADRAFSLVNDRVTFDGFSFGEGVTNKVLAMLNGGFDAEPLFNFLRKVRSNPSATAQNELLLFCVANGFLIHEDGDIIAYKAVRDDYKDIHSGTILNKVGAVISIPRNAVDDNRDRTCSYGLHFASHEYALSFGNGHGHLMAMKINPKDVVSIPSDYNNQKGRTCRYEVIAEIPDYGKIPSKEVLTDTDLGVRFDETEEDAFMFGYSVGYADMNATYTGDYPAAFTKGATAGRADVAEAQKNRADRAVTYSVKRDAQGRFVSSAATLPKRDAQGRFTK